MKSPRYVAVPFLQVPLFNHGQAVARRVLMPSSTSPLPRASRIFWPDREEMMRLAANSRCLIADAFPPSEGGGDLPILFCLSDNLSAVSSRSSGIGRLDA
jgi:hypothetical protein